MAIFYMAVGAELSAHAVDASAMMLERQSYILAPEAVQYLWRHPRLPLLYAAFSNRGTSSRDDHHGVALYRMNREGGALSAFREPVALPSRPIHLTLTPDGRHMLVAYNMPSALTVHRLRDDGTIGEEVRQAAPVDAGIYAHQVRVAPSGRLVVLSARGNDATATKPAEPGALKVFRFQDGQLSLTASVTEGDGLEFGPRHVDFHPQHPWLYVALERGNRLLTYGLEEDGITPAPLFAQDTTLQNARREAPVQYAGAIHLHPGGRHVYVVNRSDSTREFRGGKVHDEGENSIACFTLDAATGEPRLTQTVDIRAFHCRTFTIHPEGRMLIAAAVAPLSVREGEGTRLVPAGLSIFRMANDGTLAFVRKLDVHAGGRPLFWCGMFSL
jgi:6-phosphogluconolactonase (cycloisomerase 2 family)